MRFRPLVAASFVLVSSPILAAPPDPNPATTAKMVTIPAYTPQVSRGVFTDNVGQSHSWAVTGGHALLWDGKPFLPVGGRFEVQSWKASATQADFQADKEAIAKLAGAGIRDVILSVPKGGLLRVSPPQIQRIIDLMDASGVTYGLSIGDAPSEILTGYDVRPGKYREALPEEGGLLRFPADRLASALYFIVGEKGGDVITSGEAQLVSEGARVQAPVIPGKNIVFVLPRVVHFSAKTSGYPNVWDGFDNYRDQLMVNLRQVKWGPGFRFFLNPLGEDLDYPEEAQSFVPTGEGFQSEWSEYLSHRYKTLDQLQKAWNITDGGVRHWTQAAQLLPLWGGGKGVQQLYDVQNGKTLRVGTDHSLFWRDLNQFKLNGLRTYMSDIAHVLKKSVANVPVVYSAKGYSPLFAEQKRGRGFDGVGVVAYGRGSDLVTRQAAYVFAQVAEAPRTLWFPIVGVADAPPGEKTATAFANRNALHADLEYLREIGGRGFYVDSVRTVEPSRQLFSLLEQPEQLKWLSDYSDVLTATGMRAAPQKGDETFTLAAMPDLVFFPRGTATASVKPLRGGGWWLPTDRVGPLYDFGVCGKAYGLSEPDGTVVYYLWNPEGVREIKLKIPKAVKAPNAPQLRWSASANGSVKRDTLTLTIGPDPIRLYGYPGIPIPEEAFPATYEETKSLIAAMRKLAGPEAGRYEAALSNVRDRFNVDNPILSYGELLKLLHEVRDLLRPYCWVEAELTKSHSFDTVSERVGAGGGLVLRVSNRGAGTPDATATYTIVVKAAGLYNVWVAASPQSSLTFRLDGKPLLDQAFVPRPEGATYAETGSGETGLVWMRLGVANLPPGVHNLEMRASGAATVDALLLTRDNFVPNGPNPPAVKP
jgi:hypothetical protein